MSAAYPIIQLGDLCDVLDSKRRPITKRDRVEGEYPYYGATGILGYVEGFIFDEPLVLIGEDGAKWGAGENTAFSAEGRYWVNNHAHVIRPHRQKLLDSWLIYQLNQVDLSPFITGLTVPKLNQAKMREIPIIVPPLDEQRRIVAVLDKAFAGIATATANAQKNLTNARALFESYLQSIFSDGGEGWSFRPFEACLQKIKYTQKIQRKDFKEIGLFPIVSQEADFINGYWDKQQDVLRVESPLVIFGDHTQVLKYIDFDFVLGADGVKLLLPIPALSAKFLLYFLSANPIKSIGYARHYRLLKELNVGFPALPEQAKITERLDELSQQIDLLEEVYEAKASALTELKQSLLHKAFAGELT